MRVRNPLHPQAIGIEQLRRGARVIEFDTDAGAIINGTVVREPYVAPLPGVSDKRLWVDLRHHKDGKVYRRALHHIGVITSPDGKWHRAFFVILAKHEGNLPKPTGEYRDGSPWRES